MTKTQYLPAEWLDENVPPPVDHPDELLRVIDGKFFIVATDDPDDDEAETWWKTEVVNGEFVEFCQFRDHGHWTITVRLAEEGSLVIEGDTGIPAEANCFYADGDIDTFAESLEDMFGYMRESDPSLAGTFSVHAYHWSKHGAWYFGVDDDGCGYFAEPGTFGSEAVH